MTIPSTIIAINLLWALSIGVLHYHKKLWRIWEDMTTKHQVTHYLIGGFNFFIIIINIYLWYLLTIK